MPNTHNRQIGERVRINNGYVNLEGIITDNSDYWQIKVTKDLKGNWNNPYANGYGINDLKRIDTTARLENYTILAKNGKQISSTIRKL